jgi:hypothetical protein
MGRDSTSSAQSKRTGDGETARLGSSWGELWRVGGGQDAGGERRVFVGANSVVGDAGGVYHASGGETARLRGILGERGERGSQYASGACSGVPGGVLVRSWAVVCAPERGRAGGVAVVDEHVVDDVVGRVDA